MSQEKIKLLFYKYFNDLTTTEENQELARLLQLGDREDEIKLLMQEAWETFYPDQALFTPDESQKILENILAAEEPERNTREKSLFNWKNIAATIALLLSAGAALYFNSPTDQQQPVVETTAEAYDQDVFPGSNKAFLTLSDGRDIVLDNADPGLLTTEGNIKIIKEEGDRLSYELSAGEEAPKTGFNTVRTPRGGQYHVILPDGTRVWLNAASSITYPVPFAGRSRDVRIEGEVFFDVSKLTGQKSKTPFIVTTGNISIEVLGTQFNINAYSDEKQVKTTLLEGSVKISTPSSSSLLNPGHEARVTASSSDIRVLKANTGQAIAWKNGYFQFQQASLEEIMRQLSKWYDVDVRYDGQPLAKRFSGEIPRNYTLLQVLEILELSQVRMTVKGKEITIRT